MIAWLSGVLRFHEEPGSLVIDVNGVGYAVTVPVGVCGDKAVGDEVQLHIYTQVREDQLALYGFEDLGQKAAFNALIGVSKVGPKLAVNVLSGVSPGELAQAIEAGDTRRLLAISGVGKRLAERLTVELRGKLELGVHSVAPTTRSARGAESATFRDLRSALANLQYRPKEVDAIVSDLARTDPDAAFDELLRRALGVLRKP